MKKDDAMHLSFHEDKFFKSNTNMKIKSMKFNIVSHALNHMSITFNSTFYHLKNTNKIISTFYN